MVPSCEPLCQFDERLYFTTFSGSLPDQTILNNTTDDTRIRPRIRGRLNNTAPGADNDAHYYFFTIDDQLVYLSFFQDWGPLNLAMVYKACILIHELLQDEDLISHRLVLYSSDDPRRKANAALIMALFVMIVQRRPPWEAFHPLACLEFMPFRDAGRGPSDFNLSIQDCLWGLWKAMQNGLCDMNEFSVEEYEFYEKVENGDWNWITPHFIAFASPLDGAWIKREKERKASEAAGGEPATPEQLKCSQNGTALQRKLPQPFINCLEYFDKHNVKLVVRLNTELYDRQVFMDRGISHEELYFDDGTNPTDEIVRKFIDMADEVIEGGGAVAVHCKAGLGRTGTLIGAYLIWKYGFTANEAIAFMRIVRPGSVVGPQQHYMYLKQLEWNKWSAVDEIRRVQEQAPTNGVSATVVTPATPPAEEDLALEPDVPMDAAPPLASPSRPSTPPRIAVPPVTPSKHVAAAEARALGIEAPGQPRKTPNAKRVTVDPDSEAEEEGDSLPPLPALKLEPAQKKPRAASKPSGITASEQRPTRVTRSAANAANVRRVAGASGHASSKSTSTATRDAALSSPNKIPRLATMQTRSKTGPAGVGQSGPSSRRVPAIPSRLPQLVAPLKRGAGAGAQGKMDLKEVAASTVKGNASSSDAWMTSNAASAVVNRNKGESNDKSKRPGLNRIRRRRSSFSAADVVA